jgi:UDP-2,3-diacylglucosamine hydrolase
VITQRRFLTFNGGNSGGDCRAESGWRLTYNRVVTQLFVSDLHLDASAPATVELFLGFLAREAREAQRLYILGDLFETWIGDDDPDPTRRKVCTALRELTSRGVEIFIMEGNRDFLYSTGFETLTGATIIADPTVAIFGGTRVLLTHGDLLCTDDHSYQELRSTVRNSRFKERVLLLDIEARQLLAAGARAGSKAHTRASAADIMDVNEKAVVAAFEATDTLKMIHGHTHRPGEHTHMTANGPAQRIVLSAWDESGEYLEIDGTSTCRRQITV